MNPDVVMISLGGGETSLSKEYYKKPAVVANYSRSIAEMIQVIGSGKPIDEEPIPAARNATLFDKATKIAQFEKRLSEISPNPEEAGEIKVIGPSLPPKTH
jgi:hypothetical protein